MARPQKIKSSLAAASPINPAPAGEAGEGVSTLRAISDAHEQNQGTADASARPTKTAGKTTSLQNGKTKQSLYLHDSTIQQLKNAAKALASNHELPEGMSGLADEAIRYYIAHLETQYNNGQPFPLYAGRLRTGRQG